MPVITVERVDGVATLWLDRAEKRNALDGAMMRGIAAAFDEIGADRSVRVVVLRGRGPVFSSGIDHSLLAEVVAATTKSPFLHMHYELQDTFHRISRLHQPVIAALHGVCVGMALELVLAADIRIATEDCVMGLPEIAFGIVPDVGGTTRLVRCCGEPRARELIMTGRVLRAKTAERYGIIHDVVADVAALDARVASRVAAFTALSPIALDLAKNLSQASVSADAATSFRLEGIIQQTLLGQPDLMTRLPAALAFIKAQLANPE
jgi:enoyl-CoA hydratase/carnithine racemase